MPKSPVDQLTLQLDQLSNEELLSIIRIIQTMLEARNDEQAAKAEGTEETRRYKWAELPAGRGKGSRRGYHEYKIINGCGPYKYLRYREGGKLRSKYLGKVVP